MLLRVKACSLLKDVCCSSTQVFGVIWKDFWKIRVFLAENKMLKADKNFSYEQKNTSTGLAVLFYIECSSFCDH